jgi:hypothetical protein
LTRRLCVYHSSLGEPVRRPLRRSAGHTRLLCARHRRPHPGDGGRRRSTARRDCRFRVVPVRRRADRRVARAGRAGGERPARRRRGWNPARRVRFPASPHCALPAWGIPRVGSRGKGDEGANAHGNARASLPGTLPLCGARASGAHAGGTPAHPAQTSGARASGAHAGGTPAHPAQTSGARASGAHAGGTRCPPGTRCRVPHLRRARGQDARTPGANLRCARPCRVRFVGKPRRAIFPFRHQDAQTSPAPTRGAGGKGDEGANAHGNAENHSSLPRTLPLRSREMRGKRAQERGTPLAAPRNSPLAQG